MYISNQSTKQILQTAKNIHHSNIYDLETPNKTVILN